MTVISERIEDIAGVGFGQDVSSDDPTWSPTPWSRNRPAVHPNLMPEEV